MSQKAFQQKAEGPAKFDLNEAAELPTAGAGEVIIKNAAAGVNPIDWKGTEQPYAAQRSFPVTCGVDGSGVVDSVGEGVTNVQKDDKVMFLTGLGPFAAYGQFSKVGAATVYKIPEEWNLLEAGTAGCALITAATAIFDKLNVQSGDTVLVNGGAGGVGCLGIQLAAAKGAKVITTCSGRNTDFVKGLGANEAIDYTKEDVVAKVKELTGGAGANKVFDTVATNPKGLLGAIAPSGHIATILPWIQDQEAAMGLFTNNITVSPILVLAYVHTNNANVAAGVAQIFDLIKNKKFKVPIQKKFAFNEINDAIEFNKAGAGIQGKIVVVVDESLV